jgi:arabinose-5-phosphate isomerase
MKSEDAAFFRRVVEKEAAAVSASAERLSDEVAHDALRLLEANRGKIVLLGVGKSGLIAKKIAATFASTGVTALFVHAADAMHGDLGLLGEDDLVIMLSNSGETDELTALLPHLGRRQIPIIAIVGNLKSTIARHARVVLDAGVSEEACPLNLAPTSSTTVALALGDALAMTFASIRQLSRDDFAINHPAGRLGKRLTLRVSDFMQTGEQHPKVAPEAPWRDVVIALSSFRMGAVNVVDHSDRLVGLITDGDLRRALMRFSATELDALNAETLMTRSPLTTEATDLAYDAFKLMNQHEKNARGLNVLPVVDAGGRAVGLLRLQDLVKAGI